MKTMDEYAADQAIDEAVPGKVLADHLAGAGPGEAGYAAVASELDGRYYVSFIEFYVPGDGEGPKPQHGIPPTPAGLAVTYREDYPSALEAGARFGFFRTLLMEEGRLTEEGFRPGLGYIHTMVEAHKGSVIAERCCQAGIETEGEDPDYEAQLARDLEAQVPTEGSRRAMISRAELGRDS